jgi:hypothetical protein
MATSEIEEAIWIEYAGSVDPRIYIRFCHSVPIYLSLRNYTIVAAEKKASSSAEPIALSKQ